MTGGLAEWRAVSGRVLLLINSPIGSPGEAAAIFDRLRDEAPEADVHVIAPWEWRPWLESRAWPEGRVRYARDVHGNAMELNYFLEQFDALEWILAHRFDFVVGSVPHSVHNDEVKGPLELRVGAFLGGGRFLAHSLPGPFLYLLERADLMVRQGRDRSVRAYREKTAGLVADLYAQWDSARRPQPAGPSTPLAEVLFERHLGALAHFDEHLAPSGPVLVPVEVAVGYMTGVDTLWHSAVGRQVAEVQSLRDLAHTLQQEINRRDELIASLSEERRQAVSERDAIIDRLRRELDRLTAGWRRAVVGRPRI